MTDKNLEIKEATVSKLVDAIFAPTESQRQYKAKLLVKLQDNPTIDMANLTLQQAKSTVKEWRLDKWWHEDGFRDWLTNSSEFKQKLEFVLGETLDEVLNIIRDTDAPAQAKVRAFEIVARLAGKEPPKVKEVKFKDSEIDKMDETQLDEFIRKHNNGK